MENGKWHQSKDSFSGAAEIGLLEAAFRGKKYLKLLLEKGANVNEINSKGETVFEVLRQNVLDFEIIDLLIKAGADLNITRLDGMRPVHCISEMDDTFAIEHFHFYGADFNVSNKSGDYPFDLAIKNDYFNPVALKLESLGMNISKTISETIRNASCIVCDKSNCSVLGRCGHNFHISCIKDLTQCSLCKVTVTPSNRIEEQFSSGTLEGFSSFEDKDILTLLEYSETSKICHKLLFEEMKKRGLFNHTADDRIFHIFNNFALKACRNGRLDLIKLLSSFKDIEVYHKTQSLINYACFSNNNDLVDFLVENGLLLTSIKKSNISKSSKAQATKRELC